MSRPGESKSPGSADKVCTLGPEIYGHWSESEIGALTDRLERRLVLELAGDVTGRGVLDVGCGSGALALALARRGAHVVGIDASSSMIEAAKQRAQTDATEATFRVGTAQSLPFQPESFDLVTAITILCFVEDAAPVFGEMARVLRPRGRLVIGELGKWSSWALSRRIRGWLGSPLWRAGRFRTERELRSLAEQAGFVVETVRGAIYYPRWTLAARLLSPWDTRLGRLGTPGAAFLALSATKPARPR